MVDLNERVKTLTELVQSIEKCYDLVHSHKDQPDWFKTERTKTLEKLSKQTTAFGYFLRDYIHPKNFGRRFNVRK